MTSDLSICFQRIQQDINSLPFNEFLLSAEEEQNLRSKKIQETIKTHLSSLPEQQRKRLRQEFEGLGPLENLLADEEITEIIVNGPENLWFERQGRLFQYEDFFLSELSFNNCVEKICQEAKEFITIAHPYAEGKFRDFRLTLIGPSLTGADVHLSLRRHPQNPWNFQKLLQMNWCLETNLVFLENLIRDRKNFLVVGATGSGKTSVLNSFLGLLPSQERVIVIEDTSEIALPNPASMRLLTREDPQEILSSIDQTQLLKRSLRLRPDRLVMGEVRGAEAKDFLMALATGHSGSFGSLHAQNAAQALIRLEMLIQMGAPQWGLTAIRRLIQLSLDSIVVVGKNSAGKRELQGIYRLSSLEDHGFLLEKTI